MTLTKILTFSFYPKLMLMSKLLLLILTVFTSTLATAQINCDGNINESYWGVPLATSTGGPQPCAGTNLRLNGLYAAANDSNIQIGIAGIVQSGHQVLLFIDSKTGGFNNAAFNRVNATASLLHMPVGTTFDTGFHADYCLVISNNTTTTTAIFHLFTLSALAGVNYAVGTITTGNTTTAAGCSIGIAPSAADFTQGYELSLPRTLLEYNPAVQANVRFLAMIIADDGTMANQFLTHADVSSINCFGKGVSGNGVQFQNETAINPVEFNPSRSLPIDFLSAKAFQVGQVIKVFWTSAAEKEMLEYQVERGFDAFTYTNIGRVTAKGTSIGQTSYEFTDAQPLLGKSFYRIKAIDKNGRSTYSAIMKMQYGRVDNTLTIYPNPVKDIINLQITGLKPDHYHLEIFNDLGQRLIERTIIHTGGYGLQQISLLPNMQKGPYRLLLRNKTYFYKQNFIVQ